MASDNKGIYEQSVVHYETINTKFTVLRSGLHQRGISRIGVKELEIRIRELEKDIEAVSSYIGIDEHRKDLRTWAGLCNKALSKIGTNFRTTELHPFVDRHGDMQRVITLAEYVQNYDPCLLLNDGSIL